MVLDKIFRFLDVFSVLGQEPDICKGGKVENCLHDTSTLSQNLSISRCFFSVLDRSLTSARGGLRWRTVCMIPAHCPRILFFLGFGQNAAKLGVQKPNAHRVPF